MRGAKSICWIALDAVGTLMFADPPVSHVYRRIGRKFGAQQSLPDVERRFQTAFQRHARADLTSSEAVEREFWRTVVGDVLADTNDPEACFAELHTWFAQPSAWRCFDDVAPALAALHAAGYRLAVATNYDERWHTVLAGLPGLQFLELSVVSSAAGWRKPHPGFFAALVEKCDCRPEQILMVGDDRQSDVLGAQQAGLEAVWIDRNRTGMQTLPEGTISSLAELMDALPH